MRYVIPYLLKEHGVHKFCGALGDADGRSQSTVTLKSVPVAMRTRTLANRRALRAWLRPVP